jgi:hypothetical protein
MDDQNMHNEIFIRSAFFISIFLIVALWGLLAPRRILTNSKKMRWFSNLSITFLNPLLLRLIFPVLAPDSSLHRRPGPTTHQSSLMIADNVLIDEMPDAKKPAHKVPVPM